MNQQIFANYQRVLNAQRVNTLNSEPKLSPKPLVFDDVFDVSIGDIQIKIPEVPQVMNKPVEHISTKQNSKALW